MLLTRRKLDEPSGLQLQQETSTDHIFENAVGLPPSPPTTDLLRNKPAASVSIGYKNFSNFIDLSKGIILATVSDPLFHTLFLTQEKLERKPPFSISSKQHNSPASVRDYSGQVIPH
jgi:hypothetical protein